MLEVKNLVKQYCGKGDVVVKALDNVSVKFPEAGMVFLLGKSGSGKSTLLNVAGGLDKPDDGEIIVKGRSSKNFSSSDFDSYRNTFVGFVFQEYNILNEFTIEQNIALALQLQNKPNDKAAVTSLLEQVDLSGFAKRKPNTLSGGQKQRVAIARALIKNPEIIMADEPTGALDSNTGKQVLDTLKKLSKTKLVIVVSHDREFAEIYGDRIIELKDGKILSDITKTYSTPENADKNVQLVGEDTITIKNAEAITEKDVKEIVSMLRKNGGEAIITASKQELPDVKRACKINDNGSRESFKETDLKNIDIKEYDGKKTKFIKSHLPLRHAVKMGASGLKSKPIRLIFTIFLAVVAFVMFGVSSTFMLYDPNYSISKAMEVSAYPDIVVGKYYNALYQNVKIDTNTGEEEISYESEEQFATRFSEEDIKEKNKNGLNFAGVFNFTITRYTNDRTFDLTLKKGDLLMQVNVSDDLQYYYPVKNVFGFTDCGEEYMTANNFSCIAGHYPVNEKEVAIPLYVANLFINTKDSGITKATQFVGKKLRIDIGNGNKELTVSGVYNVGDIPSKYDDLKQITNNKINEKQDPDKYKLAISLKDYLAHSFNSVLFVSDNFYSAYESSIQNYDGGNYVDSKWVKSLIVREYEIFDGDDVLNYSSGYYTDKIVEQNASSFKLFNVDGTAKTAFTLNDDEIYVSERLYNDALRNRVQTYVDKFEDYSKYDLSTKEVLFDDDYANLRNNLYELSNTITILNDYLSVYYPKVAYRNYLYSAAEYLRNKDYSTYGDETDFDKAYAKISNRLYNDNETDFTDNDWQVIENVVKTDFEREDNIQAYYYVKLKEIRSFNYWVLGDETDNIMSQLESNSCDDFESVKTRIDLAYEKLMGNPITSTAYTVNTDSVLPDTIYYKDRSGAMGVLNVVGYFRLSSGSGSEFIITDDFIIAHGIIENNGDGYTWKTRYQSAYNEPKNAKYNYIVSKTNNSQEQITVALNGNDSVVYKINNGVCQELDYFLDMITELQTIFLIIAIAVGGFAALMLLNFISVSISSKRKDIGILRAVGARGTDVFKIFFAESFIIAIICFVLAVIGSFIVCFELNNSLDEIVQMQLLNFSVINVALIFGVSLFVSILATFLPVYFAARKSPVDSIRAL